MIAAPPTLVDVRNLVKDHQALRPLRLRTLSVAAGDIVSLSGLDLHGAEALVHLLTGAMLPDVGVVRLFGHDTRAIPDGDAWLRSLDGLGLVSPRAVLIEAFTALQNIAMSFTLEVDPIDPRVGPQAAALAREAGLDAALADRPVGSLPPGAKIRTHMARALALAPKLVIAEHPTSALPRNEVTALARDLSHIVRARGLGLLVLTADDEFARVLGGVRRTLDAATGTLRAPGLLTRIFGSTT